MEASDPKPETAWLIEFTGGHRCWYGFGGSHVGMFQDLANAIRFSRKQDAEAMIRGLCLAAVATEHVLEGGRIMDNSMSDRDANNRKIADFLKLAIIDQEIPDFYTSESANAMLLEAMPVRTVLEHIPSGLWDCGISATDIWVVTADRKTATCEAFIQWKEQEGKK